MTTLKRLLLERITRTGPISVADYMADCLLHPKHGYYTNRDPFGAKGDFTTAPEISQMFGELVGLALAQAWMDQDRPARFTLAELGPGRGTLMTDILRATKAVTGFHQAANLHLVEASPILRRIQCQTLAGYDLTHSDGVSTLPDDAPLFLVANEFFDALPIHQFIRDGSGWRERQIGADGKNLTFTETAALAVPSLSDRLEDTRDGDLVEICHPASALVAEIAARIQTHGGAALIVDYGDWHSLGDTLQALHKHSPDDPLAHPGQADLTAHVDFEALANAAPNLTPSRLTPQGVFLERLGITGRARALAAHFDGDALTSHIAAHRRLTHPDEMGTLYKVMALTRKGSPPVAGLLHDT